MLICGDGGCTYCICSIVTYQAFKGLRHVKEGYLHSISNLVIMVQNRKTELVCRNALHEFCGSVKYCVICWFVCEGKVSVDFFGLTCKLCLLTHKIALWQCCLSGMCQIQASSRDLKNKKRSPWFFHLHWAGGTRSITESFGSVSIFTSVFVQSCLYSTAVVVGAKM